MTRTLFLFLLMMFYFSAQGQISYIFNRFSHANGLNTSKVNCVWQDKKGFLWIGTENGIQRFDGRKFINFRSDNLNHSIPPLGVDQILDSGNGKMWIRQGNIIGIFNPVSFHYSKIPIHPKIQLPAQSELNLFIDSQGNTFLCTHKTGLLY